jgi:hypothetical protein
LGAWEQFRHGESAPYRNPGPQIVGSLGPQGERPFTAAFAVHVHDRRWVEGHGGEGEGQQFRHAQPGRKSQMEHGPVAEARPGLHIGSVKQGLHLGHGEMRDEGDGGFLGRDGKDSSAVFQEGRDAVFEKTHEGFDRSQAGIPGTGAVTSRGLAIGEKLHYQRRIELFKRQC